MLMMFVKVDAIQRALEAGARGYLLKTTPAKELVEVIRQTHAGKKRIPAEVAAHLAEHIGDDPLTAREVEVLKDLAEGNRNRILGNDCSSRRRPLRFTLNTSWRTRDNDRTQAVSIAVRRGIIEL